MSNNIMVGAPMSLLGANHEEMEAFISSLPKMKGWLPETTLHKFEGHWLYKQTLEGILIAQQKFILPPNSVTLITFPKCGTTWFAALLFTVINRTRFDFISHPLLNTSPHECVPWIEYIGEGNISSILKVPSTVPIFKTHIQYELLPESVKTSNCPIIYVSRNPLDAFVSYWHFMNTIRPKEEPLGINEALDLYCQGASVNGSYWDHVLSYWKASLEMPNKVLFVRYEDMKNQPINILKKVARFIGFPFSIEEEQDVMIEKIVEFCSFGSLISFKANQEGQLDLNLPGLTVMKNSFYRKGNVGDYKNYLTDEMINRVLELTNIKFKGSGLQIFA